MKTKPFVYGTCILVLVAVLFAAGCTSVFPGSGKSTPVPTEPPTTSQPETPGQALCGFTSCHGLDLACGMNPPQACTMEYRIGDRCRQYARCDTGGGGCTLVNEPQFTACKACSERCQVQAGPNSQAALSCEEKC
jgi:hypothetical protein